MIKEAFFHKWSVAFIVKGMTMSAFAIQSSKLYAQDCPVESVNLQPYSGQNNTAQIFANNIISIGNARMTVSHPYGSNRLTTDQISDSHETGAHGLRLGHSGSANSFNNRIETKISFSSPVRDFSFRLNDIDAGDRIRIIARDHNNQIIQLTAANYTFHPNTVISYLPNEGTTGEFRSVETDIPNNNRRATIDFAFNGIYISEVLFQYYDSNAGGTYTIAKFSGVDESTCSQEDYCVTGDCNPNTFINSYDPNTLEYDNIVSAFHATIVREADGTIKIWGEGASSGGYGIGSGNVLTPTEISPANGYSYGGKILKFTAGSNQNLQQFAILTTAGLYSWGNSGQLIPSGLQAQGVFTKLVVGTYNASGNIADKGDGLPHGVIPADVKMMFGTRRGMAIVTCTGEAWVLSPEVNLYGDGGAGGSSAGNVWHRVSTAAGIPLANVVAVRGTYLNFIALTASGELYTWGNGALLGNNTAPAARSFATRMTKPAGVTPKMIGMTRSATSGEASYYLLATDGRLYSMGANSRRQLGDGTTTDSYSWKEVTATDAGASLGGNIAWISPQEHDGNDAYPAINVITTDGKLWAWGSNHANMLGIPGGSGFYNPTYMPGRITGPHDETKLNITDELLAVETGGHTSIVIKKCTVKFGYVGHRIYGSMADGTAVDEHEDTYNFSETAKLAVCGALTAPVVQDELKTCPGETVNLRDAEPVALPGEVSTIRWYHDINHNNPVADPSAVGPGTYYAFYVLSTGILSDCPSEMTVSLYAKGESSPCANYWYGTEDTDWSKEINWTWEYVPVDGEDIEFATEENNDGNAAINDLYLDKDRIIGDLINQSETAKDLVVTTGNQLTVEGKVHEDNTGIIVVKADPLNQKTNGTLIFTDPDSNPNVQATVEFYNKAYECDNCGFYRKQWQYFGIPVQSSAFPYSGDETVNQWSEPVNGNKWITPASPLQAFKGYQITNTAATDVPDHIYNFNGTLNVGNAIVPLTRTPQVNYSGANLIGNSFTAAIPIATGFSFSTEIADKAVYLFNTGTRDQWRKLNGSTATGVAGGQYLSVPFHLAGQPGLPSVIPSMHSFMIFADPATTLTIDYTKLVKNELVKDAVGNDIATRSAGSNPQNEEETTVQQLPSLVMDVVGEKSADRVWIFSKQGTTHGFDSGWDGRKMEENGITQLYVSGSDHSKLQVATVPDMNNVSLGFVPDSDGRYTLEFSLSGQLKNAEIQLYDEITKTNERIHDGGSYSFEAKKGETPNRFRLTYGAPLSQLSPDEKLIEVTATDDGKIIIENRSNNDCSAFLSGKGAPRGRIEVKAGGKETIEGLSAGTYIIRLQNAVITDVKRVTIR